MVKWPTRLPSENTLEWLIRPVILIILHHLSKAWAQRCDLSEHLSIEPCLVLAERWASDVVRSNLGFGGMVSKGELGVLALPVVGLAGFATVEGARKMAGLVVDAGTGGAMRLSLFTTDDA